MRVSHLVHSLTDILALHGDQPFSLTVDGKETNFGISDFGPNAEGNGYTVHLRTIEATPAAAEVTEETVDEAEVPADTVA